MIAEGEQLYDLLTINDLIHCLIEEQDITCYTIAAVNPNLELEQSCVLNGTPYPMTCA